MLRASLGTTLALLGALGATAAGSLTAHASPAVEPSADTFSVVSAGASATNPDELIVTVDSPSAFAGLTAQFLIDGTDPYNQTMAEQSSETDPNDANQTQTTWTAFILAGTSGLPLGTYAVDLQGTFTDSSTYTASNAGVFTTPTLSLKVNPVTETYGKPATVTGTLSYTSGSTSAPVAGQEVWVNTTKSSAYALATGTTTDNGSFSITLPKRATGGTLYVGSTSATELSAVVVPLTLKVVHPTEVSSFKVSLNQYNELSASGCLGFPSSDTTERIDHTSGLTVQYSPSANGPWKNLFKINGNESDTTCGTGGIKFSGSFDAPENYAYYRVVYAGTTGATSYAATGSNAVLTWRYADRITDFKVSPTVVNAGGKLTIKGTLQYYFKTWHDYSGQIIWINLHPEGSNSTWYWMVKVKTNSKGQFSATFKDPVSATWDAVFEGNDSNGVGHLFAGSSEVYVRLK